MKRILFSITVIATLSISLVGLTQSFFSDTETSTDNTFVAGVIDLLVDSTCHYFRDGQDVGCGEGPEFGNWQSTDLGSIHKFFNFADIKPGDHGEDTISLTVNTNDSWLCSDITLTTSGENGLTGPELALNDTENGPFDGELDQYLQFLLWPDDGDNVLEDDELAIGVEQGSLSFLVGDNHLWQLTLADASHNFWGDVGPFPGGDTKYIGAGWCFGDISPSPLAPGNHDASINPGFVCSPDNVTNIAQSDIVTGDISFRAQQSRNNPGFLCEDCQHIEETWVTTVVEDSQGLRRNGTPVLDNRSNPNAATGPAQGTKAPGTFFSLGFGGSLTLEFEHAIEDLAGNDLSFHEITNLPYPEEKADIFVSQNGTDFEFIGTVTNVGNPLQFLDIGASTFDWIKFVRLIDTTNPNLFNTIPDADGYDIDGLDAQNFNTCIELE